VTVGQAGGAWAGGWNEPGVLSVVIVESGQPGTGVFVYSGAPAAGNPPIIWLTSASTDPYGNTLTAPGVMLAETASSGNAAGGLIWNSVTPGAAEPLLALFPDSTVGFTGHSPFILGRAWNRGLPDEHLSLALGGGAGTGSSSPVMLELFGLSKDSTTVLPHVELYCGSAAPGLTANFDQFGQTLATAAGFQGQVPMTQADVSSHTASTTGFQNLTKIWSVPAGDVQVNTVHRLTASGTISAGTTPQVLTFCLNDYSSTAVQLPIGSAEFLAGTSYWWRAQGDIVWNVAGVSAAFSGGLSVELGVSGANQATVAGTAQTAGGFAGFGTASGIDTTVNGSVALQAKWGSTTGSPSITGDYSVFERLGS
jgi:hypothetical protein